MIAVAIVAIVAFLLAAGLVYRWQSHLMAQVRIGQLTDEHQKALNELERSVGSRLADIGAAFERYGRDQDERLTALEVQFGTTKAQKALKESYRR